MALTPRPLSSIPAPRAPSLPDSSRKTSEAPRESSSDSMEPPQKKMRRDEQRDRERDHQVKDGSSQSYVGMNQERDSLDSNRENNLQNYEVGDQPEVFNEFLKKIFKKFCFRNRKSSVSMKEKTNE